MYEVLKIIWIPDIIFLGTRYSKSILKTSYKDDGERWKSISLNCSFYPFWSQLAFLSDLMATVYEPHMYLTRDLLKSASSNIKGIYSYQKAWQDLKVKEGIVITEEQSVISFSNNNNF